MASGFSLTQRLEKFVHNLGRDLLGKMRRHRKSLIKSKYKWWNTSCALRGGIVIVFIVVVMCFIKICGVHIYFIYVDVSYG